MARQSIFIGSASESKELASAIAKALADAGHRPLRWWLEFPPGSITIDRLMEIAASADGAAFLLTSTDRTWYRQEVSGSPRDNVILEYGLFVARNGRQRTLILTEQGTKLPSDILGITSEKILEDAQTVAERTVEHFNRQFSDPLPPPLEAFDLLLIPSCLTSKSVIHCPQVGINGIFTSELKEQKTGSQQSMSRAMSLVSRNWNYGTSR